MQKTHKKNLLSFRCFFVLFLFLLCVACVWDTNQQNPPYLTLDDSEYPYAGLPRFVIETENLRDVRDVVTEIPAKLQIYGSKQPETNLLSLTVRGRGTSSFHSMPKYSLKLEFDDKIELLGMPQNRDWALISNSADKTLLKNFITLKLALWLGADYSPKCKFVELYLNREYMGVYLLTETVKVAKQRVSIPQNSDSYLFEKTTTHRIKKTDVCITTNSNYLFCIKHPKNVTPEKQSLLKKHLDSLELAIQAPITKDSISKWINIEDFIRFYWIQEFSKNADADFKRSIFMTWIPGNPVIFGPVWDFDVAYGNWVTEATRSIDGWYVRYSGWNKSLFTHTSIADESKKYWSNNKQIFASLPDSIKFYAAKLQKASNNEFKRWPVLENDENWTYKEAYSSYIEAIDSLNSWIIQRFNWINENL